MSHVAVDRPARATLLREEPYIGADPQNPNRPHATGKPLQFVVDQLLQAKLHYYSPLSRQQRTVVERFRELVQWWQAEVGPLSSTTEMAMQPAYQQIIGLGSEAVPLILRELEKKPDHWFWALKAITGVDPVEPTQRGRVEKMAKAWLRWGRGQGII
jgi:hypothetical protein